MNMLTVLLVPEGDAVNLEADDMMKVWIDVIIGVVQIAILVAALVMTRRHFRKSRAAHFIERFNSADHVTLRTAVDKWLGEHKENSERLEALKADLTLATQVTAFANLFHELGAAYEEHSIDRKYTCRVFDYLVSHYWKQLEFWVQDGKEADSPPRLSRFRLLAERIEGDARRFEK